MPDMQDDLRFEIVAEDETARAMRSVQRELRTIERNMSAIRTAGMGASRAVVHGMNTSARAASTMGRSMDSASRHTGNLAAQFNDIGVMLASGQSPLLLALQQGTQINQVFGQMGNGRTVLKSLGAAALSLINPMSLATIGIIAGGAALFQYGKKAFGASEEVRNFRDALKEIESQTASMKDEIELLQSGLGSDAELKVQKQLNMLIAEREQLIRNGLAQGQGLDVATLNANNVLAENIAHLTETLEIYRANAAKLEEERALKKAADAAKAVADELGIGAASALDLAGVDLAKPISDARKEAALLAGELGVSLQHAERIMERRALETRLSDSGFARRFASEDAAMTVSLVPQRLSQTAIDAALGRGGSTGGGSAARANAGLADAQRLYEATRTEAEKYAAELAEINRLHQEFPKIVNDDVRVRALKMLQEDFRKLDGTAMQVANSIRTAFDNVFDDPAAALEQLTQQLLQTALYMGLGQGMPGLFGADGLIPLANANGNAFSGGRVQAFASGGVIGGPTLFGMAGGKTGLMGESGPEAIMPLRRIGGRLGVDASGGTPVVVNIRNYGSAHARVEKSSGPSGREIIDVIIEEDTVRGRFDRANRSRYGSQVATVRR